MADETLDIKVDDGGSTTTVTNNLEKLATAADGVGTSLDRANGAASTSAAGFNTAGDAADKAGTAVKGYVDANGNYIRQVGANATASAAARTASDAMRSSLSAVSIEQGRAAAGYGALNAATTSSASANAAFNTSVRSLNTELGTYATSTATAADDNAKLSNASEEAANSSDKAADAHDRSAGGAGRNGSAANGARATYGAFNETILDTIRRLGLLAVAYATVRTAAIAGDNINAANSIRTLGETAEQTSTTMQQLGAIQRQLGTDINTLAQSYRSGAVAFKAINQDGSMVATMIQQISNMARAGGSTFQQYSTVAKTVFDTFQGGVSTSQTLQAILANMPGSIDLLLSAYQQLSGAMGSSTAVSQQFRAALASGQISIAQFASILNTASQAVNQNAQATGVTLTQAYNQLSGSLTDYVGTSQQGITLTNLLSAAMLELAQHPQVIVIGLTAIAAAIVAIGIGAFITALGVLGGALATVAAGIGSVLTLFGLISATTSAVVIGITGLVTWLYRNAEAYNQVSDSMGIISQFNAAVANGIVATANYIGQIVTAAYQWVTSFKFVQEAITYVTTALGGVGTAIGAWVTNLEKAASDAVSSFNNMKSSIAELGATYGTTAKPMASITQLASDGRGALLNYTTAAEGAAGSVTGLGTAATGTAGALGSYTSAVGNAANATGTFASAADRLASQLAGTQAGVGEFTQATINATASMSNIEKSSNGAVAGLNAVGAAFRQAGNDAEFFAINSKNANTVAGQIGGSTASGLDVTALQGLGLGQGIPANSTPNEVISIMTKNAYALLGRDPTNSAAINYLQGQKDLRAGAVKAGSADNAASYYDEDGQLNDKGRKLLGLPELTAANSNNTSATAANTAALNANTRASTAANENLPDLVAALDPRNSTTVTGLGANGRPTVGTSVTQTTYTTPPPPVAQDTGPSADVVARMNGGFYPGKGPMGPTTNDTSGAGMNYQTRGPMGPVNITIKSDDYGQFQRSQRQIAMDIGTRVMAAGS
jgi:trimeric autotransporter adhesin